MKRNKLPAEIVALDEGLTTMRDSSRSDGEDLNQLRWTWTWNPDNPGRVSPARYAKAVRCDVWDVLASAERHVDLMTDITRSLALDDESGYMADFEEKVYPEGALARLLGVSVGELAVWRDNGEGPPWFGSADTGIAYDAAPALRWMLGVRE